jgi:branched-chain amino acid transport system permease protein
MARRLPLLLALLSLTLLAACRVDPARGLACERLIGAFEPDVSAIEVLERATFGAAGEGVALTYRARQGDGSWRRSWIRCRFASQRFGPGRHALRGVETARQGRLDEPALFWLRRWQEIYLGETLAPRVPAPERVEGQEAPDPADPLLPWLYALQQCINAITLTGVYALLALGFTLVYGLIGKINFAFGELFMMGAVTTTLWSGVLALVGLAGHLATPLIAALMAITGAALGGWTMGRTVFLPLRAHAGHAALIAAIALSIAIQEGVRLLQGAGDLWIPADLGLSFVVARTTGFTVVTGWKQIGIVLLAALALLALQALISHGRFGRAYRAADDDLAAAELMGIDSRAVIRRTFALGGALAGLGGVLLAQHYGVANFFMGFLIGFKALTAAILGGIGSLPGALLGAALVAFLETFWAAYLGAAYRDVAVFTVLALVLVLRPGGLLGATGTPAPLPLGR